jgi:hypothetical protein
LHEQHADLGRLAVDLPEATRRDAVGCRRVPIQTEVLVVRREAQRALWIAEEERLLQAQELGRYPKAVDLEVVNGSHRHPASIGTRVHLTDPNSAPRPCHGQNCRSSFGVRPRSPAHYTPLEGHSKRARGLGKRCNLRPDCWRGCSCHCSCRRALPCADVRGRSKTHVTPYTERRRTATDAIMAAWQCAGPALSDRCALARGGRGAACTLVAAAMLDHHFDHPCRCSGRFATVRWRRASGQGHRLVAMAPLSRSQSVRMSRRVSRLPAISSGDWSV